MLDSENMRPDRTTRWLAALLLLLAVALAVLATLQYRWIGEVSRAEEERMRGSLDAASRRFADDLNRELGRVMGTFPPPPPDRDASMALAHHYDEWVSQDGDPQIYTSDGSGNTFVLDPKTMEKKRSMESSGGGILYTVQP